MVLLPKNHVFFLMLKAAKNSNATLFGLAKTGMCSAQKKFSQDFPGKLKMCCVMHEKLPETLICFSSFQAS